MMATGDLVSSPLAAALDPRVDVESIQDQMTPAANNDEEDLGADATEQGEDEEDLEEEQQLMFSFDFEPVDTISPQGDSLTQADEQTEQQTVDPVSAQNDLTKAL